MGKVISISDGPESVILEKLRAKDRKRAEKAFDDYKRRMLTKNKKPPAETRGNKILNHSKF